VNKRDREMLREGSSVSIAFHEAAHGVVACALGSGCVGIRLFFEKKEGGAELCSGGVATMKRSLKKTKLAAMAIAGHAAALLFYNQKTDVAEVFEKLKTADLSESDRQMFEAIPVARRMEAVKKSMAILKKHWNVVAAVAFELVHDKDERSFVHAYHLSQEYADYLLSPIYAEQKKWKKNAYKLWRKGAIGQRPDKGRPLR